MSLNKSHYNVFLIYFSPIVSFFWFFFVSHHIEENFLHRTKHQSFVESFNLKSAMVKKEERGGGGSSEWGEAETNQ